jgi:SAM-dependent methyltransferase
VARNPSNDLFAVLQSEYDHPFQGWDFSYITSSGRMQEGLLPWNYASIVLNAARKASSLLDIGTGGGELLSLLLPLPSKAYATESYAPNVEVAKRRLEPLGVKVMRTKAGGPLPFESNTFDVVIDRHEEYSAPEVFRVLRKGGTFITQQVGPKNNGSLYRSLGLHGVATIAWNQREAVKELEGVGFDIKDQREALAVTRFYDVGALVYYLKAIPWEVPDFSVKRYFGVLKRLNQFVLRTGYVETEKHRCLIVAKKATG